MVIRKGSMNFHDLIKAAALDQLYYVRITANSDIFNARLHLTACSVGAPSLNEVITLQSHANYLSHDTRAKGSLASISLLRPLLIQKLNLFGD